MTSVASLRPRVAACDAPRGALERDLSIGPWRIRFNGVDAALDRVLSERWSGFWTSTEGAAQRIVRVVRGDGSTWIPPGPAGERYRIEAVADECGVLACSYRFALARRGPDAWTLVLEDDGAEPIGRIAENAARYLVARVAAESGGAALHGAGVIRNGRAFVFAGPSRSGKSTAVALSGGAVSLGDDYAVLLRTPRGWEVPAVPFDNSERAPTYEGPPAPLGLVCRLHQAPSPKLARRQGPLAHASLAASLAFPWALPDLLDRLHDAVDALVSSGRFAELWFGPEPSFWCLLESPEA